MTVAGEICSRGFVWLCVDIQRAREFAWVVIVVFGDSGWAFSAAMAVGMCIDFAWLGVEIRRAEDCLVVVVVVFGNSGRGHMFPCSCVFERGYLGGRGICFGGD
eukprot:8126679-Pyramimonas_sp.AAC.1